MEALGFAPLEGFGVQFASAITADENVEEVLVSACSYSLVEPDKALGMGKWRVHPVIAARLRLRADASAINDRWTAWMHACLTSDARLAELASEKPAISSWLALASPEALLALPEEALDFAIRFGPHAAWLVAWKRLLASDIPTDGQRAMAGHCAAALAVATGAYEEAIQTARVAHLFALASDEAIEAVLSASLQADALAHLGRHDAAQEVTDALVRPHLDGLPSTLKFRLTLDISNRTLWSGKEEEAYELMRTEVIPQMKHQPENMVRLGSLAVATLLTETGRPERAIEFIDQVLGEFLDPDTKPEGAWVAAVRANALALSGRVDEAIEFRRRVVVPKFESLQFFWEVADTRVRNAIDQLFLGNTSGALDEIRAAEVASKKAGAPHDGIARAKWMLGEVLAGRLPTSRSTGT